MPKPKGGRPRVPDRAALTGIIFVLKSGFPWEMLPTEMAAARGAHAGGACETGRNLGCGASCTGRASTGLEKPIRSTGPGPRSTRRVWRLKEAKPSTKSVGSRKTGFEAPPCGGWGRGPAHGSPHHRECTRLEGVRGSGGRHRADQEAEGRPRKRPEKLHAAKDSDAKKCKDTLRKRGIKSRTARKVVETSEKLAVTGE